MYESVSEVMKDGWMDPGFPFYKSSDKLRSFPVRGGVGGGARGSAHCAQFLALISSTSAIANFYQGFPLVF